MTYSYIPKSQSDLEAIAQQVLSEHPTRLRGFAVDIEAILDDVGVDVVFRRGLNRYVEGYLSRDPNKIVMDEAAFANVGRARFTLAEEYCHRILEKELWDDDSLCDVHRCDKITWQCHGDIESDAKRLAGAILMPQGSFCPQYNASLDKHKRSGLPENLAVRAAMKECAKLFEVSDFACAYRAMDCRLITKQRLNKMFPAR